MKTKKKDQPTLRVSILERFLHQRGIKTDKTPILVKAESDEAKEEAHSSSEDDSDSTQPSSSV